MKKLLVSLPHGAPRRIGLTVSAIASAVLLISACGAGSSGSSADDSEAAAAACAAASEATTSVIGASPTEPVNGAALKGKSIWIIPVNNAGTVTQYINNMKAVAADLGAQVTTFDAKGSIPSAINGVNQAIAQGADVIVNIALNPTLVEKVLTQAQAKGIKVIDVVNSQPGTPAPAGADASVSWDYEGAGFARTAQAICDTKGSLKAGFVSADDIPVTALQFSGVNRALKELCPDTCSLETINVPSAQWATGLAPAVTNLFQRNPDLNYLMPAYGAMNSPMAAAMKRINAGGKITVNAWDLQPELVGPLVSGEISSDVGAAFGALAYPTIYQSLRILNDQEPVEVAGSWRMVTSKLANELGLRADASPEATQALIFGEDVVEGVDYKALWGTNLPR